MSDNLLGAVDSVVNKYSEETNVINTVNVQTNLDIFYKKLEEEMHFDLTELKPVLECEDRFQQILAGAGVGKTTTLVLKMIRSAIAGTSLKSVAVPDAFGGETIVLKPMKILMGTFLKSGADELRASFFSWCKKLGIKGISNESITFSTLHKEFIDAIKFFGGNVKIADDNTTSDIVRSIMKKWGVHSQSGYSRTITNEEVNDIKGLFTYCRNRLDAEKLKHPLFQEYGLDSAIFEKMLFDYNIHLNALNELDFEATQELLHKYLQLNPAIYEALKNRYDIVLVDEFQDTSQLQYEILKPYFEGAKKAIVIGDDDQTIYSWRGSDIDIIVRRFKEDYNPTVLNLSSNHRCPENILNPVIPSIMENKNRHPKRLKASKKGGIVDVIYNITSDALIESINKDLAEYENVGIISRTNNDLLIPAILLELGCSVDFQTSKAVSLNSRLPKNICSSIDLITKRYNDSFDAILKSIFPRNVYFEITMLCNLLSTNPSVNLYNISDEDLDASVPFIAPFIRGLKKAKAISEINAFAYILDYMIRVTFAKDTNYCIKARTFAEFIKDLVLNSKVTANMDIYAIDRLLNCELPARIAKRNKPLQNPRIKLTTVHDAKGKEWDSVYIWNDTDGTFPVSMVRETSEAEYEEERRLHYIAWTRAKKHLTVCTSTKNPSPFLLECTIPNVALKKGEESIIGEQKMVNPKSGLSDRVKGYINPYILNTSDATNDEVREDINVLLGFLNESAIVLKVTDFIFANKTLSINNDDCIKIALRSLAQDYVNMLTT